MAVLTLDRVVSLHDGTTDWRARCSVAALSAGAAAVHLPMAPGHLGESALLGGGFIVAAWVQLAIGVLAMTQPSQCLWLATIAANVGIVGTWAVSRTAGLPLSAHAGKVESMSIVDGAVGDGHHGATSSPEHDQIPALGSGVRGRSHTHVEVVLDPASQAALDAQLAVTRETAAL